MCYNDAMKKVFYVLSIGALLLSSCSLLGAYKNHAQTLKVFEIDKLDDSNIWLDDCQTISIDARFIDGEKYVPYLSLEQYASLYETHFAENAVSEVKIERGAVTWSITVEGDLYFYAAISPIAKQIIIAGDIENAFKEGDNPRDLSALNYGVSNTGKYVHLGDVNYTTYSYSGSSIKTIKDNNQYYFPLGLLDLTFSGSSGIYFFYNYRHIYATRDVENYATFTFETHSIGWFGDGRLKTTVEQEMEYFVDDNEMPEYLIKYNADLFFFLMDNLYGLKKIRNISSIKSYYSRYAFYEGLFSSDGKVRGSAYSNALAVLDDNHTTLVSVGKAWGEEREPIGGQGVYSRSLLRSKLTEIRNDYLKRTFNVREEDEGGQVFYSDSGKTAMFHFETFSYGDAESVFDNKKQIKPYAYIFDTYINFLRLFDDIKAHGGVKNVIIDISTNRGGTVGVMMKLLALISKDNRSTVALCDEPTMGISVYNSRVDVNGDGQYTDDEAYGDDFNIAILTSDCSFSCGNAFPCYAKQLGVKIIGEKSGGGECAVGIHYLPNSQYVYHSSNLHLGIYDDTAKTFTGLEDGAVVDIPLNNNKPMSYIDWSDNHVFDIPNNFYDINNLENLLNR